MRRRLRGLARAPQRVDRAMRAMQDNGDLRAFNVAYKRARQRGEPVAPYAATRERLRRIVIGVLIDTPRGMLLPDLLGERLHGAFPGIAGRSDRNALLQVRLWRRRHCFKFRGRARRLRAD